MLLINNKFYIYLDTYQKDRYQHHIHHQLSYVIKYQSCDLQPCFQDLCGILSIWPYSFRI